MIVDDISATPNADGVVLSASVSFDTHWVWGDDPFPLWIQYPAAVAAHVDPRNGSPFHPGAAAHRHVPRRTTGHPGRARRALFFSLGVDSTYTLLRTLHADQPTTHLVMVEGFDVYRILRPSGTHPLLDPLWSTDEVTFVHHGLEADRLGKRRAPDLVRQIRCDIETARGSLQELLLALGDGAEDRRLHDALAAALAANAAGVGR